MGFWDDPFFWEAEERFYASQASEAVTAADPRQEAEDDTQRSTPVPPYGPWTPVRREAA